MPSPVSASSRRRSPSSGGSSSSGERTCRTISSEPVAASSRMTRSAAGIEQVRQQDRPRHVRGAAPRHAGRRRAGPSDPRRHRSRTGPTAAGRRDRIRAAPPAGGRSDRTARRPGPGPRSRGRCSPSAAAARFANRSLDGRPVRHRGRRVDEQADRDVLLLDEELHEQLLEPGVDVPVELAKVVARRVVAVVGELHGLAALDASPSALQAATDGRSHEQEQALELAQERLVEDGRVHLAGQEDLPRAGRGRRAGVRGGLGGRTVHRAVARAGGGRGATRPSGRRPRRGSSARPPRS